MPDKISIHVDGLVMRYGAKDALKGVSVDIPQGEKVAILGPNGAGKTTLMEILEGFRVPSGGVAEVLGIDPSRGDDEWRSQLGIVFQLASDHARWKVRDLLQFVSASHRLTGRRTSRTLADVVSSWELADLLERRLKELSGGQRRRVDVAAALLGQPKILFLDEPTTGFDPAMKKVFHDVVGRLSPGTTLLLATHDLEEAEAVCDRILLVKDGQIVADGTPLELRQAFTELTTVSWVSEQEGRQMVQLTDPSELIAQLAMDSSISELEIQRGTLEDAYLAIISDTRPAERYVNGDK